jgi:poly(hydroxyalkanoate) depolymerase family esterase
MACDTICRVRRLGILVLLLGCLFGAGVPATRAAPTPESWRFVGGGARDYWVYVPAGTPPRSARPLVVYLHGCTQNNAPDPQLAFGTRWNNVAAKVGAVVLYPLEKPYDMDHPDRVDGNGASCWNWFLDQNMHRGAGEPAVLAALTKQVAAANNVDASRIYVSGVSAGADMANILGITYPDVFRASALFAGCAYAVCTDIAGTLASRELAGRKPGPAMIVQGDGDMLNNVVMGETLLRQHVGMRGLPPTPSSTTQHAARGPLNPGGGNVCVGAHNNFPCVAGVTGWQSYPYTVKRWNDARRHVAVEWWVVHGLNHDYPNGDYDATFTDPAGPDVTSAAWQFFKNTQ